MVRVHDAARTDAPRERGRFAQLGRLIVAEAVRLIRLGGTSEIAEQAALLTREATGNRGQRLRSAGAPAFDSVNAAALVLTAAALPSGRGGELAVFRGWNGKARAVAARVASSTQGYVARSDLRDSLGLSESHLSHILSDLEEAGLVLRIRHGREVRVHAGAKASLPHVKELLGLTDTPRVPDQLGARRIRRAPQPTRRVRCESRRPAQMFAEA
jgi:DNA-binding transcriptional ArsR family regulator